MNTITMWMGLLNESGEELPIPRVQVQLTQKGDGTYAADRNVFFGAMPMDVTVAGCRMFPNEFGGKSEFDIAIHLPRTIRRTEIITINSIGDISANAAAPFVRSLSFDEWVANSGDTPIDPKKLWDAAFIAGSRFMYTLTEKA